MRHSLSLLLAVLCSAAAFSQTPTAQPANHRAQSAGPVQPQPYTVELKTTSVQTLANGTTITRESTLIRATDSQHRYYYSSTRESPTGNPQKSVTAVRVEDPVENTRTTWNSQSHEARVLTLPPVDQRQGCWQSDLGHTQFNYGPARPASGTVASLTGSNSVVTTIGVVGTAGLNPAADNSAAGIGSGFGGAGATAGNGVPPKIEDLGASTIEGVEVHGTRITRTIATGQAGNDQPLVITSETWAAPSLGGISLRSVRDDPRSAKSTTEVVRLDLSEPPLSTFQPPEGYKVTVEELHQVACHSPAMP